MQHFIMVSIETKDNYTVVGSELESSCKAKLAHYNNVYKTDCKGDPTSSIFSTMVPNILGKVIKVCMLI